jgi:dihydroneopterin aldolase
MITISLHGAEFFAYHGFYPEEQQLGAKFIVDIEVDFVPLDDIKVDKLANTVDYEQLHNIACLQMQKTMKLIETVAQNIADKIKMQYPFVKTIRVSIKKMNPPMSGKVNYSAILVTV